ncbi:MAG: prepilin-type N-terminal cleavage/methylation domain-containing protein [Candidatus Omnitrophica bacterium]|nr:prepilin-type N-terminal cleavage/methylation domain-containing protein [Candidatus Omnitrophota bacterium]MBU1923954.1 prepilin-type N-terminal cleavage/methylation domain-containing protein [Candidatus Omnitrophota bacterium]
MRHKRGFTFIELIMVIAIIGILAGAGAWIMVYTVKNSVFIPNQLGMDKLATDALNVMVEGDAQAKGLRFSREITAINAYRVDFIDGDGKTVYFRLDTGTNKLYRSINGAGEQAIPAYSSVSGLNLSGKSGALFTFYDAASAVTAAAANVRRIQIILIAKSGTGLYNDWQGQSEQASSVAVKKLQ